MANAWHLAEIGWMITVLGWLLSPIIGLLLNKILSYLGFDASQKLRELEINTIPKLTLTLREAEEQRMLKEANKKRSDVNKLDKLASMLKSDLYEAEDILDLIDYHRIEKKVVGDGESQDSSWLQRLYDAVGTCISRCKRTWLGRWAQQRLFLLGRWARQRLYATLHRSAARLPISCAPSISSVQRLCCWSRSFDFNSSCRSIFIWLANKIEVARSYRNWSYDVVGITSYQENAIALDSCLPTVSRLMLKKRIEIIENNVTEVQKSPLLNLPSNSVPNGIPNINRSRIRSTTTRKVFGRDEDRDKITKMLRETPPDDAPSSSSSKCFSVIGIHGIAGSGKTTLAQYVRDYEKEAKDKYFDPIMCIHVSETFSVDNKFREMLKDATVLKAATEGRQSNIEDCKDPKAKLEQELKGKRFFLVLDDIWVKDENYQELKELLSPLNGGKRGSKILVTTRRKGAASALGAQILIAISDLNEEQYFSMFMHYALGDTSLDNPQYNRIGRKIVEKLCSSPIAAVIVARQLSANTEIDFWRTTVELDQLSETMGALQWSYQQLDVDIRRCFVYCSIFPRRYELERDMLVHMWIAQGFVKVTNSREDVADVGQNYFHQLHSFLFLQLEWKIPSAVDSGEFFRIHDLLHDLAERVAGSDCLRIEKGVVGQIPQDVHHLCIVSYGEIVIPEQILEMKNLRTLIMCYSVKKMSKENFERVLMRLRKLRVVRVELQPLGTIPACIGELKHLRYLGVFQAAGVFPHNLILPPEFTKLYHLQELFVGPFTRLHCSSKEKMSNLINLRYMFTRHHLYFPDIGRLTSLRTLYRFYVRNERGYEIQQLEHLNSLRGTLSIEHLENVKSKEEALQAKLADKEHLTQLTLEWGGSFNSCSPELQTEVLEGLHPPSQITFLYIRGYGGLRYPSWLSRERCTQEDIRDVPALQKLMFWRCSGSGVPPKIGAFFIHLYNICIVECSWNSLPENMDRLTSLKVLIIQDCPNIESLPPLPPYLESFTLIHCNRWNSLPENMDRLTSLKELIIIDCPNIESLPPLPPYVQIFTLVHCNRSLTESCKKIGHPNWRKIDKIQHKARIHIR